MIRRATEEDTDWLVDTMHTFNSRYVSEPLDLNKVRSTAEFLIEHGVVLRSRSGAIVGMYMDDPFRNARYLFELAWYAEDGSGLKLLREFERIGREAGVNAIRMSTLEANRASEIALKRGGYKVLETAWTLELGEQNGD